MTDVACHAPSIESILARGASGQTATFASILPSFRPLVNHLEDSLSEPSDQKSTCLGHEGTSSRSGSIFPEQLISLATCIGVGIGIDQVVAAIPHVQRIV